MSTRKVHAQIFCPPLQIQMLDVVVLSLMKDGQGLWTDALSISKMSPNLCLSKPHSDDVTSVMLAIISAAFL